MFHAIRRDACVAGPSQKESSATVAMRCRGTIGENAVEPSHGLLSQEGISDSTANTSGKLYEKVEHQTSKLKKKAPKIGGSAANIA